VAFALADPDQQLAPEKMAIVLKSGFKVRNSQMTSMLRWHSA
jgi:hypothetical protein